MILLCESKISLQLLKAFENIFNMLNRIKYENVAIKQAHFNEINWFVYILKLVWWSLSTMQCHTKRKQSILYYIIYCKWMLFLFLYFIYFIVPWHL